MKKSLFILSCIILLIGFTSCLKPKHKMRIVNNYPMALRVVVGTIDYKTITSGSTSAYKDIPEGSHTISGDVKGNVSVKGRGKHNWTVTISAAGDCSIKEEK